MSNNAFWKILSMLTMTYRERKRVCPLCGKIIQKKVGCSLLPLSVFDRTEYFFLIFT